MRGERFIVVTGGPGSGKSTLIDALQDRGFVCTIEAGRAIIRDQTAIGGRALPWVDPALFAEAMLFWEMRSYAIASGQPGAVFFDRGVPDVLGYLRLSGLDIPAHVAKATELFRYRTRVFIAPPWEAIFHQDQERRQDFAEAMRTYSMMATVYTECGYELMELPRASVKDRADFIIQSLAQ